MADIAVTQSEMDRLSESEKQDISQYAQNETQKLLVQNKIHEYSEVCFKKCIRGGSISGGRLTSKENTCMVNCVNRFMDSNLTILKHLEMMRSNQ